MRFTCFLAATPLLFTSLAATAQRPLHTQQIVQEYGNLPLAFEANRGQTDSAVQFLSRGAGYNILLRKDGADFLLRSDDGKRQMFKVRLVNAAAPDPRGAESLPGVVNYLRGEQANWITGVPTFARVRYTDVYPSTDLVYYGNHAQLEYDFVLRAGADPRAIAMKIDGASVLVTEDGSLELRGPGGSVVWHKPVAYQERDGKRLPVKAWYEVKEDVVRFGVGAYDRRRELVIDPALAYSTYLGGSGGEVANGIAVDASGNAYIAGDTLSPDFPTTSGAYDRTCGTDGKCDLNSDGYVRDAFVTKLNSSGTALVYSTYLGGSDYDSARGVAVDGSGNAVVVGETLSTDFATSTLGPAASGNNTGAAFAVKLNSTGSGLVYARRFGGAVCSDGAGASGVKADSSGNAYVVGETDCSDFSTTSGAFQPTYAGAPSGTGGDAFVAKINPSGTAFVWASYLGGTMRDVAWDLALDSSNNVYVTGYTSSTDFPVSSTAFQKTLPSTASSGATSTFVTKVNASGSSLGYSTYLGGSFQDIGNGIAVVGDNAVVTGTAQSSNFPTTSGVVQRTLKGLSDAFVTRLNSTGSGLVYSTLLGGSGDDWATGVAVNSSGNAYVIGTTYSTDFPNTVYGFQRVRLDNNQFSDDFVTEFTPDGKALAYSSYLGGSSYEEDQNFSRITIDANRNVYAAGKTESSDFPTTPTAYKTTNNGTYDAWAVKIVPLCGLGTTSPSITICKPAANATVASPVEIMTGTFDLTPVWVTQVYVDGKKVYEQHLSSLDVKLPMSAGTHRVTVQGIDVKNVAFKKTIYITVK